MDKKELQEYLNYKFEQYNTAQFIETDPIQLPHKFNHKEDIEIIAFLVSTIAWGKREMIIKSGNRIIDIMGDSPHDFIMNYSSTKPQNFVHRTFNGIDLDFFFQSLHNIYSNGGLENAFEIHEEIPGVKGRICQFRDAFLQTPHNPRSDKHVSNPAKNSAAKRINMFLRWMIRKDNSGVDFGIWNKIPTSELCIPLDVHTANVSRNLGLLKRKQNDWKALEEIMISLREFDQNDPSKYDFALFGIGAFE